MSFWKKLFSRSSTKPNKTLEPVIIEYQGYEIEPSPIDEGGQFRLSGIIRKNMGTDIREHLLIRADVFSSAEDASEATIQKAKTLISEQGDQIFL